ncbi:hypothetical protein [Phenylobacterium sp.]|uniref:hypothetical protein n=1 Tax=Phenylobacterium sp. TaxID=1871053 RepID=UPI00391C1F43
METVAVIAAVGWPFAVALGLVAWSRARDARRIGDRPDDEQARRYRMVDGRAVPERLALVLEALEEAQARRPAARKPGSKEAKTPAPAT